VSLAPFAVRKTVGSMRIGKTKTRRTEPGLERINQRFIESGSVRLFRLGDVLSLGAFLSLHDFKLHVITFLQALIALRVDGAIVNKNIRAVIPADEAEALRIVKPLHFTFYSRHVPYSTGPRGSRVLQNSRDHLSISTWDFATA